MFFLFIYIIIFVTIAPESPSQHQGEDNVQTLHKKAFVHPKTSWFQDTVRGANQSCKRYLI